MGLAVKYKFKTSPKQLKKSYELRLAAQFGDRNAKDRLAAYNRRMKELRKMDYKQEWIVDGKILNRQHMMHYIVAQVSEGTSLPVLCDTRGMPTMQEVYSWFDNYPDFERDYNRAEEIRAHRMGERALEIAVDTDRENVSADKLKVEALLKAAARGNKRFQDKQVIEQKDEYASMTPDQIRERIKRMLDANPDLALSFPSQAALGTAMQPPEPAVPTLDLAETDIHEQAD